jgi:hypothetical protein
MKDKQSLHLKLQEQIDCQGDTDYLTEMPAVQNESDRTEGALKWLALAVLHGINAKAKEITIKKTPDGDVRVEAEYRKSELPSPGKEVGGQVIQSFSDILHVEGDKAKMPLSVGVRDSSVELEVKVKKEDKGEKVEIKFPE